MVCVGLDEVDGLSHVIKLMVMIETMLKWLHHSSTEKSSMDVMDFMEIQRFVNWCDDNHLALNINKIEEMVFDPRGGVTSDLWSFTTTPSPKCNHINTLVYLLTAHSPGAHTSTTSAADYNNDCTSYDVSEFSVDGKFLLIFL